MKTVNRKQKAYIQMAFTNLRNEVPQGRGEKEKAYRVELQPYLYFFFKKEILAHVAKYQWLFQKDLGDIGIYSVIA